MRAIGGAIALLSTVVAAPAAAAPSHAFAVPPGRLSAAIVAVGAQAGISIGLTDPALGDLMVPGVTGRIPVARALARLVRGTPAEVVAIDADTFRIVRRKPAAKTAPPPAEAAASSEIIVTGSKRGTPLAHYPGSIAVIDTATFTPAEPGRGTDALIDRAPILSSTHLGPGRDKVFIRGIADSSFNGPSQSTVGEYLGDARLNYNAPDPDLALYDVASVEILEGPQGTLYGAGTLGGIVRLVPVPPDMTDWQGSLSGGGAFTHDGSSSGDVAAVVNVPIVPGTLALRGVGYAIRDGGFIDDPARGITDVNFTRTNGGRATLRYTPATDWTIDLGGVVQDIDTRDGSYAIRGLPPLTRDSVIAQPFDNDYALGDLTVQHRIGAITLTSTTSVVSHDVNTTYDASPSVYAPTRYVEDNKILLVSNETRVSHTSADGSGWVIGGQYLHSRSRLARTLGPVGSEPSIAGTLNTVDEGALYGEATIRLIGTLYATGGARFALDHLVGQVIDETTPQREIRRKEFSALPSVGLLWQVRPRVALYARYQEGYRPGGLTVEAGATQRFEADSVATWEAGVRLGTPQDRWSGTIAGSYAHWEDIQADLVDAYGLPYTDNIGTGHVLGLEAQAHWKAFAGFSIDASLFADHSQLDRPDPGFAGGRGSLPDIPGVTARLDGRYAFTVLGHATTSTASLRYVGRSRLAVGPTIDLPQGRYLDAAAGITTRFGPVSVSVDADNLTDTRRNIFSLGNPFGVTRGDQVTPLRPRTIRLGAVIDF